MKYVYFIQNRKTGEIRYLTLEETRNLKLLYKKYNNSTEYILCRAYPSPTNYFVQEYENNKWSEREYY